MKANELRIGNWFNEFGIPKQVTPNLILKLYQIEIAGKVAIDISPIPLTPEILVKAGFEWSIYHQGFYKQDFVFVLHEYEDGFRFKLFRSSEYVGVKINHMHQLQNLYFALTGEELEINFAPVKPEFPKDRIGQWKGGA
jgi:hypothetical protein